MKHSQDITKLTDKLKKYGMSTHKSTTNPTILNLVQPDKPVTPIILAISNFTKKMKNRETSYSSPFFTYEGGHQTCLRVDAGGRGAGRSSHVSVFLQVTKGSNNDSLPFPPLNGYCVIELISQVMIVPNKLRILPPYNDSCSTCNKVTKHIGDTWLGFTTFVSNDSVYAHYLKDDSLQFRVTYSEYFWYIDAVLIYMPDVPVFVLSAIVSSVMMYWLLMSLEYVAFCTEQSNAFSFTVGNIKRFLLTKQDKLLNIHYVAMYTTLWQFIMYALTIVMEVVLIAIGELVVWDMPTMSDNIVPTLMTVRRIAIVIVFSMAVDQYVTSWGRKVVIVHPFWFVMAYSYGVAGY